MISFDGLCLILSLVCFLLAVYDPSKFARLVAAGLAFWVLTLLIA